MTAPRRDKRTSSGHVTRASFASVPSGSGSALNKSAPKPSIAAMLATIGRLATSLIWVPIKKLFEDKVPADGSDVCVLGNDALKPAEGKNK